MSGGASPRTGVPVLTGGGGEDEVRSLAETVCDGKFTATRLDFRARIAFVRPPMDCHATTSESLLMPFCQCPKCKAVFTIQVADSKAWYTEKWPGYAASELVPEICPACAEGDGSDDREGWRSTAAPIWPALRLCHAQTTPAACHAAMRRLPRRATARLILYCCPPCLPRTHVADSPDGRNGMGGGSSPRTRVPVLTRGGGETEVRSLAETVCDGTFTATRLDFRARIAFVRPPMDCHCQAAAGKSSQAGKRASNRIYTQEMAQRCCHSPM